MVNWKRLYTDASKMLSMYQDEIVPGYRKHIEEMEKSRVAVIHCKDCKHYGWEQEPCHGRTQHFCKLHKGLVVVDRDTFCSYGERKDNETLQELP